MILTIELISILLSIALIVVVAVLPDALARLRQNDNWIEENNWRP